MYSEYKDNEVFNNNNDNNKSSSNLWIIIIGIVLVVAGLAIGVYLLFFRKGDEKVEPPTNGLEKITPLMYEVTKEGSNNKIYLFGSIHFANIDELEFPKYLLDAYNNSDYIACEFDINKFLESTDQVELAKSYLYLDGTSLKDHINNNLYDKLIAFIKENYGYSEEITSRFNLIYVESLITQYYLTQAHINSTQGIDTHFLNKA